jgi:predicted N-acetyltransferase YhbS
MSITIRRAVPDDAPAILQLNVAFDDARATVDHIAAHIRARSHFETPFVAQVDGRVVGLACLRLLPCLCDPVPYAELTELIVDPLYRRRGAGRALVRKIESEARGAGCSDAGLDDGPGQLNGAGFLPDPGLSPLDH